MTRNNRNKELIDWEQQLSSIIDRTDENLRHLTSEFNRAKSNQAMKARSTSRRIEGSNDALNRQKINHHSQEGHSRLALSVETERVMNEKLKPISLAIDALRDQICNVADECKALNGQSARVERRLDAACYDIDRRSSVINDIVSTISSTTNRFTAYSTWKLEATRTWRCFYIGLEVKQPFSISSSELNIWHYRQVRSFLFLKMKLKE